MDEFELRMRREAGDPTGPSWNGRRPSWAKAGCGCDFCRWHRGDPDGRALVMCSRDWRALPLEARFEISESVAD